MDISLQTALITAVATLFGSLVTMAGWFKAQFTAITSKLDDCEDDRNDLWAALAENGIRRPAHPVRHTKRRDRGDDTN